MAIHIQPNQIWLLYLIKCSLRRKSHRVWKRRAIHKEQCCSVALSSSHLPPPTLGPVCLLPGADWLPPSLLPFFLISVVMAST